MGIPKFFSWMTRKYPVVLHQVVQGDSIPDIDNLYLDMNGIIHSCSHPSTPDANFKITEPEIFSGIFASLEHLFKLAKPRKLFFLAVDGVAPRAKMNEQRSRRFKAAKANAAMIQRSPAWQRIDAGNFDSNCITPGTPFMARLHEQFKYFLNKKVSEDPAWQAIHVIFSGHDVPGEGEHKIMQYIRHAKTLDTYNPHLRHCIYGLDADLIMLALLSHEPHFCLLREENRLPLKRKPTLALKDQQFHLLQIAFFRDYLNWEFSSLQSMKNFKYDIQRIIDDFILLCIFVGNDFLPHLPNLHIDEGAIGVLFEIYKRVLPQAGGYLNDSGILHTHRLQLILDELVSHEYKSFESSHGIGLKRPGRPGVDYPVNDTQFALVQQVENFIRSNVYSPNKSTAKLVLPGCSNGQDRTLLRDLAEKLNLWISFDNDQESHAPLISLGFEEDDSDDLRLADPVVDAVYGIIRDLRVDGVTQPGTQKYSLDPHSEEVLSQYKPTATRWYGHRRRGQETEDDTFHKTLRQWKTDYYYDKMRLHHHDCDQLHKLTHAYIEGLQWVLHYYYTGVASWSWAYPYHYSPMITDLDKMASYKFSFDLGNPFKPFEQLMGVLPGLSSTHVPPAFQDLMTKPESPIFDLYPSHFETDLNGKKKEWQAIAKIPFIDSERLLKAMKDHESKLKDEEVERNRFGPTWQFRYDSQKADYYPSPLPDHFPHLGLCHSQMTVYHLPVVLKKNPGKLSETDAASQNIEKLLALYL
ncbi:hypothetical protein Pst134EA_021253 [Puccinia striiformis f. sp. tritici]|uniref:hypothetical protein n=3 Tax=Puccinia striiformis f. sp. tritici TaxID=168172 RepID=UPI0020086C7F|nr:hypothetical protein Pst134EA_021253 [Puccinia striiformis f. sp. tritici]KAH9457372.1 hypothetical protein Pst134EA_021253 [Puccinia striiformis f. sp. tritici]